MMMSKTDEGNDDELLNIKTKTPRTTNRVQCRKVIKLLVIKLLI